MKAQGHTLLEQVSEHVKSLEAHLLLQSPVNELESNEILITQLEEGKTNFETGKEGIKQSSIEQKA